jgi:hypothetical protein
LLIALSFTSCTNDEPVIAEQNIEESAAIKTLLAQLRTRFDNEGNVIANKNIAGNIVFDFGFDFVYPLNLSYNNGTSVTVNSLDNLVDIMINSTNNLFIAGIEFPFNVEVYSDTENAIVVTTINNENEFLVLLQSFDFGNDFSCECTEEYNPVCVEIKAPDGESFLMTYPNACHAECDGFIEADFAEDCGGDYNWTGREVCFTYNFPLTIITDEGATITLNSQEELINAVYNSYYYDFVYSFDVTLADGTVLSIGNEEAFLELLESCYGDDVIDDCGCNFEFTPVCVQYKEDGDVIVQVFPNACTAECEGFTVADFVDCENDNSPTACSEEDIINMLTECQWTPISNTFPDLQGKIFEFDTDGSVTITDLGTSETFTGTFDTSSNLSGEVYIFFNLPDSIEDIGSLDWTVVYCGEGVIDLQSENTILTFIRNCD